MAHSTHSLPCLCCETQQERRALLLPLKQVTAPYRDVLLCDVCIETCNEILEAEDIATDAVPPPTPARLHALPSRQQYCCSFCGRAEAQVMRLIALLNTMRICHLCVGACNSAATALQQSASLGTMPPPSSDPVAVLHQLDLGQHTLFLMSDGSMDLVANDEHTLYLADNALHLNQDEAYRLFTVLYEQFKKRDERNRV